MDTSNALNIANTNAALQVSEFIGLPISLHAESGYTQEQFDIVLM